MWSCPTTSWREGGPSRSPPDQSELEGVISMYAHCALQADEGAGWPARWSDFDAH